MNLRLDNGRSNDYPADMKTWLGERLRARRGFDSVEQELYLSLQHTADALRFELKRLFKSEDLTAPAYNVLRILRGASEHGPDGLSCTDIAERLINRDPDVTRLVDRLEKRGLVERTRSESARRVVRVAITASGLELLERLDEPVLELHREQLGHLGKRRLGELARLLMSVRDRQC